MSLMRCQLVAVTLTMAVSCCLAATAPAVNIENDVLHFSYGLEQSLDVDKRPCQDFYAYVCGRSLNTTRAQQEQLKFDKFLANGNNEQLLDAELKLKNFYESCKSARSPEELKSSLMYRMSAGWPAVDNTPGMLRKRHNMTWLGVLSVFHEVGVERFFHVRVEIRSNRRVVHLRPDVTPRYSLRRYEQLAGQVMQDYNVETGRARLVALEILNFERNRREIANAEVADNVTELTYERFRTSLFRNPLADQWDAYFKHLLGKPLKPTDTVLIQELPRLMQYFELLHNTTMTRLLNWIWIDYLMDKKLDDCRALAENYFEPVYYHIVEHSAIDKVQMGQMYADLGQKYTDILSQAKWIDEMSQHNSRQFLGRIMHLTLNGDEQLDTDLASLTVTPRNFYRNLEKVQRYAKQQRQHQFGLRTVPANDEASVAANEFMKIFLTANTLLQQQNLTTPLNYVLVGQRFSEKMIAGGSSIGTPGAWRSMESDQEFAAFRHCVARQEGRSSGGAPSYDFNALLLKMLAQQQTLLALDRWQESNAAVVRSLDALLAAGRLQLSLRKLYFIGALLADCGRFDGDTNQKELLHSSLRNSPNFTQTFGCQPSEALYARNVCKVL